jgi:hypothetical protein
MGSVPVQIGLSQGETTNIKNLKNAEIMIEEDHVSRETMGVLKIEAKHPIGIICNGVVPSRVEVVNRFRTVEEICNLTQQGGKLRLIHC